jgi:hypothetical protein
MDHHSSASSGHVSIACTPKNSRHDLNVQRHSRRHAPFNDLPDECAQDRHMGDLGSQSIRVLDRAIISTSGRRTGLRMLTLLHAVFTSTTPPKAAIDTFEVLPIQCYPLA